MYVANFFSGNVHSFSVFCTCLTLLNFHCVQVGIYISFFSCMCIQKVLRVSLGHTTPDSLQYICVYVYSKLFLTKMCNLFSVFAQVSFFSLHSLQYTKTRTFLLSLCTNKPGKNVFSMSLDRGTLSLSSMYYVCVLYYVHSNKHELFLILSGMNYFARLFFLTSCMCMCLCECMCLCMCVLVMLGWR